MTALPIPACAAELGLTAKQLRYMIGQGAPVVRRGQRGAGNATLLEPAAVREWMVSHGDHSAEIERRRLALAVIENVAAALVECCRADSGPHKATVTRHHVITFEHTATRICAQLGLPPLERSEWPECIQQMDKTVSIFA